MDKCNFNFNCGMFGDTKPKVSIRDMFDEKGEPIVYDIYGNPVREESPATVGQVDNEPRKHERGNNERMLPSGNKELKPITVLIWAYL